MPIWKTDCGKEFRVNLSNDLITQWKEDGCRLCLFKDNPDIRDENSCFYASQQMNITTDEMKQNPIRRLHDKIDVMSVEGYMIRGEIIHVYRKYPEEHYDDFDVDWFIISPN